MTKTWRNRFLKLAIHISTWSKDPSTKVGCVIVDNENKIVATGFNGLPSFIIDHDDLLNNREAKYGLIRHAEINGLEVAAFEKFEAPFKIFVTAHPCEHCARAISYAKVPISEVHWISDAEFESRWDVSTAKNVFSDRNVKFFFYEKEELDNESN